MKNFLKLFLIVILLNLLGCDRHPPRGTYEFLYVNKTNIDLSVTFINEQDILSFYIPANLDTMLIVNWIEDNGFLFPENQDSAFIHFETQEFLQYSNNINVNQKNLIDWNTYDVFIKESNQKNEDNREYVFEITEQDYLLADSL
jgi:hypothetical protein